MKKNYMKYGKRVKHLVIILLLVSVNSCKRPSCDCIYAQKDQQYSDAYLLLIQKALFHYIGDFQITKEEILLESAIMQELEPLNCSAYQYKAMALYWKKEYNEVIEVVDVVLSKNCEVPDLVFLKARMYDIMGDSENANVTLAFAEQIYDNWLKCYPDSIALQTARIGCVAYAHGKDVAIRELDELIKKYPGNQIIEGCKEELENQFKVSWFNREGCQAYEKYNNEW